MNRYRTSLIAALLTTLAATLGTTPPPTPARTPAPPPPSAPPPPRRPAPGRGHRSPGPGPFTGRASAPSAPSPTAGASAAAPPGPTGRGLADADLTHNWWGVFPQPGTHDGITATHSVDPAYKVSDAENFTYAPTTKAQKSCMEVVTSYWNSGNEIWAWDWCGAGGPAKVVPVDADFLATYTTTGGGRRTYSVQLVQDDASANRWSSYLYNYRSGAWNLLYSQSGTDRSGLDHGWDMFEIYASTDPATGLGYYCTEARNTVFDSSAVQLRSSGIWKPAGPADSPWTEDHPQGSEFLCPSLRFIEAGANDHWTVRQ
ncbi:hypothetical protein GCM10020000_72000 [Streptomyces olivoverticillatus]